MKQHYLFLLIGLSLFSCGKDGKESSGSDSSSVAAADATAELEQSKYAVCIWEKVVLRETPEDKGKYLASVNLAEKVEYLDETKVDESGSKKREYCKVKLMDGKEGWVLKDFIVEKAKAAAMTNDVDLYARPELIAKTNKMFRKMNIVGVSEFQGDWCKVKGKRTEGTWIDEGWVKTSNLSYDEKDLAVSLYTKQAMAQSSVDKKVEELNKILSNKDFEGSVFLTDVQNLVNELAPMPNTEYPDEPEMEEDTAVIEGD